MGPLLRRLRAMINPISTGLTARWLGIGHRRVPPSAGAERDDVPHLDAVRTFYGVSSPGSWTVPTGQRPGWDWLPEHGASPNLRAIPWWARMWYRMPLLDRYAYEWMWWHGGWSVWVPGDTAPPPDSGAREPRRPQPTAPAGAAAAKPSHTAR